MDTTQSQVDVLPACIPLLVVDDDQSVRDITRLVLSRFHFENKALEIIPAASACQAREILLERDDIALMLLDVVMESDDAGLQLVEWVRHQQQNHQVRILLRTGQPGCAPEREVIERYDINDYIHKTDASVQRLQLSITTAIRSYRDILRAQHFAYQAARADKAGRAKIQFLAHMSHEIRTPLSGLVGAVSLLQQTELSAAQQRLLADIGHSSDALLAVVNDVLDVAKLEEGKLQLNLQPLKLTDLLNKLEAIFAANMQQKGLTFAIDKQPEVPDVILVDALRVQQVLQNFIANAYKFTNQGGDIQLQLECFQLTAREVLDLNCLAQPLLTTETGSGNGQTYLRFRVMDTGVGIDGERLGQIFDAYEQASVATAERFGGTGLGLSLCRSLAELMDGCVGVQSELGRGSEFWLSVPLLPLPLPLPKDQSAQQSRCISAQTPLSAQGLKAKGLKPKELKAEGLNSEGGALAGVTIALCDDDATTRKIFSRILQQQGAQLQLFEQGQQLLDQGGFARWDIILLDYHMPQLTGIATAERLRAQGVKVPIVALTASVAEHEHQQCLAAGMNAVFSKPIAAEQLIRRVRECLLTHG